MKKTLIVILVVFLIIAGVGTYLYIDGKNIKTTDYTVYSRNLDSAFNGYRIAVISDYHGTGNVDEIIEKTKSEKPDIITIIGDFIDMSETDFTEPVDLAKGLVGIAPTYFVSGNHEQWSNGKDEALSMIEKTGVKILNDKVETITYQSHKINLVGFEDMVFSDDVMRFNELDEHLKKVKSKVEDPDLFSILLFHRANYIDEADKYGYDLILSGHEHGGQIGIPYVAHKILQHECKDTEYIKGYFRTENSQAIVSGGLSDQFNRPRILNSPEIVTVKLMAIN